MKWVVLSFDEKKEGMLKSVTLLFLWICLFLSFLGGDFVVLEI